MKFQWSIQPSHIQLVLSQVVYLNYRNEHIWHSTRKWLHIFEPFHLASLQFIIFDHFWTVHLILRLVSEIFYISILRVSLWLFGHHTFQYKSFFLFSSQILVCATVFATHYFFSRFDICVLCSKFITASRFMCEWVLPLFTNSFLSLESAIGCFVTE